MRWSTNTFYNRGQKKEAKAQEREKGKEVSHAQMLAALQKAYGKPRVLKGQGTKQMPSL